MKKKFVATVLAASMMAGALTGCGSNQETANKATEKATVAKQAEAAAVAPAPEVKDDNFNETGYPIVNEPITLNVVCAVRDTDNFAPTDEMPALKDLEAKTGIRTEWEFIKKADWDTKLNLIFASGEYPDIIIAQQAPLDEEEYGVSQGIVLPLDELIETYMPTYTERVNAEESDPTVGLPASDGKIYTVGNLWAQDIWTRSHFFINDGWMQTLGLETPDTVEELTEVLRAFKTQDPNGNGEADEIPMTYDMNRSDFNIRYLFNLFGLPMDTLNYKWIYLNNDKQVEFAPVKDEFRACMEWLNLCYNEGLLDIETLTQDSNMIKSKLTEGTVGFFSNWRLNGMGYDKSPTTENCKVYVPGEGTQMLRTIEVAAPAVYVTCTNENIPATMRYIDAMLETETMFGMYYSEQFDKPMTNDEAIEKGLYGWFYGEDGRASTAGTAPEVKDFIGVSGLFFGPANYISKVYNPPATRVEKTQYCNQYEDAGIIQKYSNNYLQFASFDAEQQSQLILKETDIENAVNEHMAAFIKNGVTDESWNNFTKIFDSMNVAEYVSMYQGAIDIMDIK